MSVGKYGRTATLHVFGVGYSRSCSAESSRGEAPALVVVAVSTGG